MQPKYGLTSLCDQNCGVQSVNKHTDRHTDRKVKTDGPKILSNDIFYLKTVIIGGPKTSLLKYFSSMYVFLVPNQFTRCQKNKQTNKQTDI